jgi:hypothetical protein
MQNTTGCTEYIEKKMADIVLFPQTIIEGITHSKKRKRNISFFDGDSYEKPRPLVTVTYDRHSGDTVSIKTFDQERRDEENDYNEWLEKKREKRAKIMKIKAEKTPEQDLTDALAQLSYISLSINNLLSESCYNKHKTSSN